MLRYSLLLSLLIPVTIFGGDTLRNIYRSDYYVDKLMALEQGIVIAAENHPETKSLDILEATDSIYIKRLQEIPAVINLPYNNHIKAYIERYLIRYPKHFPILLERSDDFFPMFEEIFDSYGLPQELKYLAVIESALKPKALSKASAVGLWQFMPSTGKMYGLQVNSFIDERKDPIKSTHAAAQFLSTLYHMFDDWTLALAAYNCGPGNVRKAIRRAGGKQDFWKIYYYLPRETRSYVPAFVGATYAFNYYAEHGIERSDYRAEILDTVNINQRMHFLQLSEFLEMPVEDIRKYNPQYRKDFVPQTGKPMTLRLPYLDAYAFAGNEEAVYAIKDSIYFSDVFAKNYSSTALNIKEKVRIVYKVKKGDNLGYISDWFNVRLSDLRYWNGINRNLIRVGQKLSIYVPESRAYLYDGVNGMSFAAKQRKY